MQRRTRLRIRWDRIIGALSVGAVCAILSAWFVIEWLG